MALVSCRVAANISSIATQRELSQDFCDLFVRLFIANEAAFSYYASCHVHPCVAAINTGGLSGEKTAA